MFVEKCETKPQRRRRRAKQNKINGKIKNRLFSHLVMAPCYWCHFVFLVDELTIEHIIPLSLGGTNEDSNITLACAPCNHQRGKESWKQKRNSPEYAAHKQRLAQQYHEQYSPEHLTENEQETVSRY